MKGKRLWHTLRLWMIPSGAKRAKYLKDKCVFRSIGVNCTFMDRKIPLYPNLIRIGNNVHLASNVAFVTHDVTHKMLNATPENGRFSENIGCISLGDNVFVGTGTTIMYDVRIGSNVIIGAGSVVTKDVPDNSVVAGVPARVISTMNAYLDKRSSRETYDVSMRPYKQEVGPKLEEWCWDNFEVKRSC